jgi:transcriptional regulator with XRE-family HTH domain
MKIRDAKAREMVERQLAVVRRRIREAIEKIGFVAAVAASGKSLTTLHRYLNGSIEPPVSVLLGLANAIGKSPSWFFQSPGMPITHVSAAWIYAMPTLWSATGQSPVCTDAARDDYEKRVRALSQAMRGDA